MYSLYIANFTWSCAYIIFDSFNAFWPKVLLVWLCLLFMCLMYFCQNLFLAFLNYIDLGMSLIYRLELGFRLQGSLKYFAFNWCVQSICINWDARYVWSQHGHVILLTYIWYYVMLYLLCFFLCIICFLTFIFHGRYLERFLLQLYSFTSCNVLNSLCLYLDFYCLVCWF